MQQTETNSNMRYCFICAKCALPDDNYCSFCGEKLETQEVEKQQTGWELPDKENDKKRYYADEMGQINSFNFADIDVDAIIINNTAVTSEPSLTRNIERAQRLWRSLIQWQALHDKPVNKNNILTCDHMMYCISYGHNKNSFGLHTTVVYSHNTFMTVLFTSEIKAKKAMEIFHEELLWYFTVFKTRLDEPNIHM